MHFGPVELLTKSTHTTQDGAQGLADGRLGSVDFRDGSWQATQGEHMGVTVQLDALTEIDSLSMQIYQYQDAWIFLPDSVRFQWSADGENWNGGWWTQRLVRQPSIPTTPRTCSVWPFRLERRRVGCGSKPATPVHAPNGTMPPAQLRGVFLDELVVHSQSK